MAEQKKTWTVAEKRASEFLVGEDYRIEVMNLVKDGRISIDKAMKKIENMEKKCIASVEEEEKEKQALLARMTPKAMKQELAKQKKLKESELKEVADKKTKNGGP